MKSAVNHVICRAAFALVVCLAADAARAQLSPLVAYGDDESLSCCDLVNGASNEFGVLAGSRELVILSGIDTILLDSFVDNEGNVTIGGEPAGFIDYADDGDGFRTLWWLSLDGTIVDLDLSTFQPFDTQLVPSQFVDVPCDGCLLWDEALTCDGLIPDEDEDGVEDCLDLCPDTSSLSVVDSDGCSCDVYDDDLDGVDNCDDFCPDTPLGANADFDGCGCFELDSDGDGVDDCDDLCSNSALGASVDATGCEIVIIVDPPGGNITNISFMCGSMSSLSLSLMAVGLLAMGRPRFRVRPRGKTE